MVSKWLVVLVVVAVVSMAESQLVGDARSIDLNDEMTKKAADSAKAYLTTNRGLCDKGMVVKSATRQITKGSKYEFVIDVSPSQCGLDSTWKSCTITVQFDIEKSTTANPVFIPSNDVCT